MVRQTATQAPAMTPKATAAPRPAAAASAAAPWTLPPAGGCGTTCAWVCTRGWERFAAAAGGSGGWAAAGVAAAVHLWHGGTCTGEAPTTGGSLGTPLPSPRQQQLELIHTHGKLIHIHQVLPVRTVAGRGMSWPYRRAARVGPQQPWPLLQQQQQQLRSLLRHTCTALTSNTGSMNGMDIPQPPRELLVLAMSHWLSRSCCRAVSLPSAPTAQPV